jgi:hypothetical protein
VTDWTQGSMEGNSGYFDTKLGHGGSRSSLVVHAASCPATARFGRLI